MRKHCLICGFKGLELCKIHDTQYMFEPTLDGYRLKKRFRGSRYTNSAYHLSEIELTKIIERYYGFEDVVTAFHPLWARTKKGVLLEYDIFIKSRKILVEYNGKQHYDYPNYFHKTQKEFTDQQKRDKRKTLLAKKHGYKLIVFNYMEPIIEDYVINKIEGSGVNNGAISK